MTQRVKRGQRVPDDIRATVVKLCESGVPTVQIAQRLDISETTTRRIMREAGVKSIARCGSLSQETKDEILRLFDSGVKPGAIATKLGYGRQSVVYQLERAGRTVQTNNGRYILEELDFLLGTDTFENLCKRLDTDPDYVVEKLLPRAGRPDLVARAVASRQRDYPHDFRADQPSRFIA